MTNQPTELLAEVDLATATVGFVGTRAEIVAMSYAQSSTPGLLVPITDAARSHVLACGGDSDAGLIVSRDGVSLRSEEADYVAAAEQETASYDASEQAREQVEAEAALQAARSTRPCAGGALPRAAHGVPTHHGETMTTKTAKMITERAAEWVANYDADTDPRGRSVYEAARALQRGDLDSIMSDLTAHEASRLDNEISRLARAAEEE